MTSKGYILLVITLHFYERIIITIGAVGAGVAWAYSSVSERLCPFLTKPSLFIYLTYVIAYAQARI